MVQFWVHQLRLLANNWGCDMNFNELFLAYFPSLARISAIISLGTIVFAVKYFKSKEYFQDKNYLEIIKTINLKRIEEQNLEKIRKRFKAIYIFFAIIYFVIILVGLIMKN